MEEMQMRSMSPEDITRMQPQQKLAVFLVPHGRLLMLLVAILIMEVSGSTYVFGAYSESIRTSLGYNQKTLDLLSTFKNVGSGLSILAGLLTEVFPPWVVLVLGSVTGLAGYLVPYLVVSKKIPQLPVPVMCFFIALGAASPSFGNTIALVTTLTNFPEADRGTVLGVLTGFGGLSGAIFTELHRFFFLAGAGNDGGATLLLLIACVPAAISLVSAFVVWWCIPQKATGSPPPRLQEHKAFDHLLYLSFILCVYLFVARLIEMIIKVTIPKPVYYSMGVVLAILVLFGPLVIVLYQQAKSPPTAPMICTNTITTTTSAVVAGSTTTRRASSPPARGEDHSVMQDLFNMLLILVISFCGISGLLTAMDNLAQIGESLGYSQAAVSMLVSLANISNYLGRVVAGFVSEYMVSRKKLPRAFFHALVLMVACAGHLTIAFGSSIGALYFASPVIGFCLGAQWPVLFAIISELFGLKHFSTLSNLVPLAASLGSCLLSVVVIGPLYDREARNHHDEKEPGTCIGVQCFQMSFLIIILVTLVGGVASMWLTCRTTKFYIDGRFISSSDATADTAANNDSVTNDMA